MAQVEVAPEAMTWWKHIYPDPSIRKQVGEDIGGRSGLQALYVNLLEPDQQSLAVAIQSKLKEKSPESGLPFPTPEELVVRLQKAGIPDVPKVVASRMIRQLQFELIGLEGEELRDLFKSFRATPCTKTRLEIERCCGYLLNGKFHHTSARNIILVGFSPDLHPKLIKFCEASEAIKAEYAILLEIQDIVGVVGPVEMIKFPRPTRVDLEEFGVEESFTAFQGLVMPFYPSDFAHIGQRVSEEMALKVGQTLKRILDDVHSRGIGHNDIKESNVFLTSQGRCVIGDWGSATRLGAQVKEGTPSYWPMHGGSTASTANDLFCLAILLLHCTKNHDLRHGPSMHNAKEGCKRLLNEELKTFIREDLLGERTQKDEPGPPADHPVPPVAALNLNPGSVSEAPRLSKGQKKALRKAKNKSKTHR